jgi:hypothetical protein
MFVYFFQFSTTKKNQIMRKILMLATVMVLASGLAIAGNKPECCKGKKCKKECVEMCKKNGCTDKCTDKCMEVCKAAGKKCCKDDNCCKKDKA